MHFYDTITVKNVETIYPVNSKIVSREKTDKFLNLHNLDQLPIVMSVPISKFKLDP